MKPTAQNHNGEDNLDSPCNPTSSSEKSTTECVPSSPTYSSESEDVYILEDEQDNLPDPRLDLIDRQFTLKMKELFSQTSCGQLVPSTVEAILQPKTDELLHHLAKSHSLTWIYHVKLTPEEDELPLWMSIKEDDIDVLVTMFQQQMYTGFSKMISEMVKLYHK